LISYTGRESLKDVSGYLPSERYSPVRRTSEPVVTSSEHLEQPNIRNIQQEHIQLQVSSTPGKNIQHKSKFKKNIFLFKNVKLLLLNSRN